MPATPQRRPCPAKSRRSSISARPRSINCGWKTAKASSSVKATSLVDGRALAIGSRVNLRLLVAAIQILRDDDERHPLTAPLPAAASSVHARLCSTIVTLVAVPLSIMAYISAVERGVNSGVSWQSAFNLDSYRDFREEDPRRTDGE